MNRASRQVSIRPSQPRFWLAAAGLLLLGALAAGNLYHRGVWLFATVFAALLIGFICDAVVFDGEKLKRRGPGAWLYGLLTGIRQEITLDQLETISSYVEKRGRRGTLLYRTVICGAGVRWEISSSQPEYHSFIKTFFRSVSPNKLDPRSHHLLAYWRESRLPELIRKSRPGSVKGTPPEKWREMANQFALDGDFETAARYFRLAYRREPGNAALLYEMGRFLQLRAMLESSPTEFRRRTPRGLSLQASCARRADACLRLAARLERRNAALLERIGESYFEIHRDQLAERYFARALRIEERRLRSSIGLAEIAFRAGRLANVIHFYRVTARLVEHETDQSLVALAERRAAYYERLQRDDSFLDAEMSRLNLLDHLKWARRGALFTFLVSWFFHLAFHQAADSLQTLSREISATAAIVWLSTIAASYLFSQRRN
jgi:tetratricopeptide (TPR) repeat protein